MSAGDFNFSLCRHDHSDAIIGQLFVWGGPCVLQRCCRIELLEATGRRRSPQEPKDRSFPALEALWSCVVQGFLQFVHGSWLLQVATGLCGGLGFGI